jgi:hypothetical protein
MTMQKLEPLGWTKKGRPIYPVCGGAYGNNSAPALQTLPDVAFQPDQARFAALTRKQVFKHTTFATPGAGAEKTFQLPQSGVIAQLRIVFDGQVVVANAADEARNEWPYGLLSRFRMNVNGATEVWNVEGEDLHVLRYLRNPAFEDALDVYPGQVGGGTDTAIGTHQVYLTWVVPVAFDMVTLVGALFAQSAAVNIECTVQQATAEDLFETPANVTLTGNWHVEITSFDVPKENGIIVAPDLSRIHAVNSVRYPVSNAGETRHELIRSSGLLTRLIISGERSDNNTLSAAAAAADADTIEAMSFEYGSQVRPYVWNPASMLLAQNNEDYGGLPPYDRLVLDTGRYNPIRDGIHLQGLTEAAIVLDLHDDVVLANGFIRLVQETLFAAAG